MTQPAPTVIRVDPAARTVLAGGGAAWADVDAATQAHGLAVTGARDPRATVAGSLLSGGTGWLERAMGLSSDSLRSAEVLTPSGAVVRASRVEHPDLFWALHGGFGTVVAAELALRPLGPLVPGGTLWFEPAAAARALARYAGLMADAPDSLCGGALLDAAGLTLVVLWAGEPAAAGPWLERIGRLGTVAYATLQRLPAAAGAPLRGGLIRELDPDAAIAVARALAPGRATLLLQPLGGAYARFGDDSAISHRDAAWAFQLLGHLPDPDPGGALRAAADVLATEAGTWPGAAYGEAAHRRLARIRRRHDRPIHPAHG